MAREAAFEKEEMFQNAKSEVEYYENRMRDIEERLKDFDGFDKQEGSDAAGFLPACKEDMYLDENMIPQHIPIEDEYGSDPYGNYGGYGDETMPGMNQGGNMGGMDM